MAFSFRGGIHPPYNKDRTFAKDIEKLPEPEEVVIPLQQHIGAPCTPVVSAGDKVDYGQKIGDCDLSSLSCPVHASVSGTVTAVEPRWHPNGTKVLSVIIKNDFEDRLSPECVPFEGNTEDLTPEEIIRIAREAGIVGMGGAAFPLYAKLKTAIEKKVDVLIINGCECEPFITCDHRAMIEYPRPIVNGIRLIMQCLGLKDAIIAIEDNKPDAVDAMTLTTENTGITVQALPTKYPQGGEKQLIKALTGREIPPGKLPMDMGCAVFNVDTCASLDRKLSRGLPLVRRVVTVSGEAVVNPKNVLGPIGTSYTDLFRFCDGFSTAPYKIINGGPMMGSAQHTLDAPVIKNTSALLAFSGEEESFAENPACIRCGRCVSACPMRLMPNYIYMYAQKGDFEQCMALNVQDCIECGCCSYSCPGRLYLVQAMRMAKSRIPR